MVDLEPLPSWREVLGKIPLRHIAYTLCALILLVSIAWLVVTFLRVPTLINSARSHGPSVATKTTGHPAPTATPTPTPAQTELDGVITIENLDQEVPFAGNVQIRSNDGRYTCRNSPLPNSTWYIQLEPGATTSVPCIIPLASPASLPPHTFRRAVTGAGGQGLALVDNPAPFLGTSFVPTPTASNTKG
jgi:hypothetical protein